MVCVILLKKFRICIKMMGTPEKMFPFVLFMCKDVRICFKDVSLSSLLDDTYSPKVKHYHNSLLYPRHK